jgi:5-methylthioadenosine/S-adenosylhomocysteine deaminase
MVDGAWVMRDRVIDWADETELSRGVQDAARRMWQVAPQVDWAGRTLDEMCPPLLEDFV